MKVKNVSASVRARLLNISRATNRPFAELLQHYAIERFLYRLGQSKHRKRFILKGALMFRAWGGSLSRPTKDIDLLGYTDNTVDNLLAITQEICTQPVEADGMTFNADSAKAQRIKEGAEYEGVRIRFLGQLGTARVNMQIDVGFADVVTPSPMMLEYPTILEMPTPQLRGYPRETVIAEKVHAMVLLGTLNSRMKDFYDLCLLARNFDFEGTTLQNAIIQTFTQRKTSLPQTLPIALSDQFASQKQHQWRAFLKRGKLTANPLEHIISELHVFPEPLLTAIANKEPFDKYWKTGGPWSKMN